MGRIEMINGTPVAVSDDFEFAVAVADPPAPVETPPAPQAPSERQTSTKPDDVPWDEWRRRGDSIRTMAREMGDLDHGDIRDFVSERTQRELTDEEVGQIRHDVIAHRVADLTDVLDEQLKGASARLKRGRVRVHAPRGWVSKTLDSLDERAVGQVAARLVERGHDAQTVTDKVIGRVKDEETRGRLGQALADQSLKVEFSGNGYPAAILPTTEMFSPADIMEFTAQVAENIAKNIKIPDVHVVVNNTGGGRKTVKRDPDTGLVTEITEEPGE